ncbi:MAG: hypothetical protein ACOC8Y_04095 [Candidatus Natronoplasma sp.]
MRVENVLQLVGDTPMVKLGNINLNPDVPIYAKLEKLNPMGSRERSLLFFPMGVRSTSVQICSMWMDA